MQMVITSDETQIQIFANWPMSQAKRVTRDNRKNPCHDKETADRHKLSRRKIWPNHVKNEQYIGSEKTFLSSVHYHSCHYIFLLSLRFNDIDIFICNVNIIYCAFFFFLPSFEIMLSPSFRKLNTYVRETYRFIMGNILKKND